MPHHIFHGRDIDILVKKPGREGTAEVMRRDVLKPRPDPVLLNHVPHGVRGERRGRVKFPPFEELPKHKFPFFSADIKPPGKGILHFRNHEHLSLLIAFADKADRTFREVHALQFDRGHLGPAHPAAKKQTENRVIPDRDRVHLNLGGIKQRLRLILGDRAAGRKTEKPYGFHKLNPSERLRVHLFQKERLVRDAFES